MKDLISRSNSSENSYRKKQTLFNQHVWKFKTPPSISIPLYGIQSIWNSSDGTLPAFYKWISRGFHPLMVQSMGIFAVSRNYLTNAILFTIHSTCLLLEELWHVPPPFMMTPQTPRLRLFWTEYGIIGLESLFLRKHSIPSPSCWSSILKWAWSQKYPTRWRSLLPNSHPQESSFIQETW